MKPIEVSNWANFDSSKVSFVKQLFRNETLPVQLLLTVTEHVGLTAYQAENKLSQILKEDAKKEIWTLVWIQILTWQCSEGKPN